MRPGHALVLFSGGQDSTTCLAWALENFAHVETIGFDYGQRHHIELQARQTVLSSLRAQFPHWNGASWGTTTCSTWRCWATSVTRR